MSAWGLDGEADEDSSKVNSQENYDHPDVGDDHADAWDWGDDKDDSEPTQSVETGATKTFSVNGLSKENERNSSQVTLKEMYNITSLPKIIYTNHHRTCF